MTFFADTSQVEEFAHDLGRVAGAVVPAVRPVLMKAAQNVKDDARAAVSGHPSWKRLAHTINYDRYGLEVEVGYDDQGQGELAGIHEFGSSRRAPHPTLYPAAEREAPKFEKAMGDASAKALRDLL